MNDERFKIWSDSRDRSASADDMMTALGDQEDLGVTDASARRGMILTGNCQHCGRQWKSVVPWAEVAMMFLGQVHDQPQWRPTRQGVVVPMGCACGKASPLLIDWDEVRRYVDIGVRSGSLDPNILRAAGGR